MRELDDCFQGSRARNHFPVAERPMAAAPGARPAGAHQGSPQHHQEVPRQHAPTKPREVSSASLGRRCDRGGQSSMYQALLKSVLGWLSRMHLVRTLLAMAVLYVIVAG